jgi:hypothetical protein
VKTTLLLLALASLGCGRKNSAARDADAATEPERLLERRSFDVTATMLSVDGGAVPTSSHFTVVLDPDTNRAVVGGAGEAKVLTVERTSDGTYHLSPTFGLGVTDSPCSTLQHLDYDTLDLVYAGGRLVGRGRGRATFSRGTAALTSPFEATLDGVADTSPPFLILPKGQAISDPLAPFQLWTSEPLPATALARLVGSDGAVAGLVPEIIDGPVPLIARFNKPNVTLEPGQGIRALFSDDVADLAGNAVAPNDELRISTVDAAPLLSPDGFETATEHLVGGAAVLRSGPGIPIAGQASVYIAYSSSPQPPAADLPTSARLLVRMAVPPGATKVHFTYRLIGVHDFSEGGTVQVGSVGRAPGPLHVVPGSSTETVSWNVGSVQESAVATMDVPLPDDRGPEVIVRIQVGPEQCAIPDPFPGLVIDDLRID